MRLDLFLVNLGRFDSRNKAKESILRGEVFVDGVKEIKPSREVDENADIKIEQAKKFVSIGGYKLDKALTEFVVDVDGKIAVDIGASTGGFTDCLIQNGAKKVFAVDLNDELLHPSLKNCKQVVSVIKNAKNLTKEDFDEKIDIVTADLSFISATSVMEVFASLIDENKSVILLIKPQFETGGKIKFKNGIIREKKYRVSACKGIYDCAISCGLIPKKITKAPNADDKNVEFLMLLEKSNSLPIAWDEIEKLC